MVFIKVTARLYFSPACGKLTTLHFSEFFLTFSLKIWQQSKKRDDRKSR